MVVIAIGCALFVASHYDVKFAFANQRFGEVYGQNAHVILHAHSLLVIV